MSLSLSSSKTIQGISPAVSIIDSLVYVNTTRNNFFLGTQAGEISKAGGAGGCNTFVGIRSGFNTSSGFGNLFIGQNAGFANTMGTENVFIGNNAGLINI